MKDGGDRGAQPTVARGLAHGRAASGSGGLGETPRWRHAPSAAAADEWRPQSRNGLKRSCSRTRARQLAGNGNAAGRHSVQAAASSRRAGSRRRTGLPMPIPNSRRRRRDGLLTGTQAQAGPAGRAVPQSKCRAGRWARAWARAWAAGTGQTIKGGARLTGSASSTLMRSHARRALLFAACWGARETPAV